MAKVNDIQFKDETGYLVVTFSVSSSFEFSKNSKAELYDTGIIGGKGIQIKPVFDGAPMAQSGDTLLTNTRPGLTELVQQKLTPLQLKVEGAVSHADSLLMNVNDVLDDKTRRSLRESIQGLTSVVNSFQKSSATLNELLETNKMHIDSSLNNINTLTSNFAKFSDSIAATNLSATVKSLESTIKNLDALLGKMEKRYVNVSVFGKKQIEYSLPQNDPALINQQ
ncbi:hypothetical protein [uncultured Muriicola sp.]|uniref:hypothetical protein n=1 Tax=uncultured Muriicola sp. TaxID=1583102 RepID=UPI00345BFA36